MMKRYIRIFILGFCIFILLWSTNAAIGADQQGFVASNFQSSSLNLNDGKVDPAWDNVTQYQKISEFGANGYVKFSHNQTYLFSLFVVDISMKWVAIEFDATPNCMDNGHDGWTFYLDSSTHAVTAHDTTYLGTAIPTNDPDEGGTNDLSIQSVVNGNYAYIEVARPLLTNDTNGHDVSFINGTMMDVKFASNVHHFDPSPVYYLYVTFGSGNVAPPKVPAKFDYQQAETIIFIVVVILAIAFILTHIIIRMILRPLGAYPRIIDENFVRPTFKSRWREIFGEKIGGQKHE